MGAVAKWALLLDIASRESTDETRDECRQYAHDCLRRAPESTQGLRYLGKFHLEELIALRSVGVPVCVHALHEGDQYYLPGARCHIVWNDDTDSASSLAHDVHDDDKCDAARIFFSNLPETLAKRLRAAVPDDVPPLRSDWRTSVSLLREHADENKLEDGKHCEVCGALLLLGDRKKELATPDAFYGYLESDKTSFVIMRGWTDSDTLQKLSDVLSKTPRKPERADDWTGDCWTFRSRCKYLREIVDVVRLYTSINPVAQATRPSELCWDTDREVLELLRRAHHHIVFVEKRPHPDLSQYLATPSAEWENGGDNPSRAEMFTFLGDDIVTRRLAPLKKTDPNAHADSSKLELLEALPPKVAQKYKSMEARVARVRRRGD
jgi:hypothetical protein